MKKIIFILLLFILKLSGQSYLNSVRQLESKIDSIGSNVDTYKRDSLSHSLISNLKLLNKIPFAKNDSVLFVYNGAASSVYWAGDFTGWNTNHKQFTGIKRGKSNLWTAKAIFPPDARLDYKIIIDGNNWILDPNNPLQQWSGFGPNSELRMPFFVYPTETIRKSTSPRGLFSGNKIISSKNLSYNVQYRVYTPNGYESMTNLPVIYVTDGHEYSDDRLGSMSIILDNLIAEKKINPLIAVFIDPRDPVTLNNKRMDEYIINPKFAEFVASELVPLIDSTYKTRNDPANRAILGTSLGGLNSAYFGYMKSSVFGLIGIHSPAFWASKDVIFNYYETSPKLPLKFYMSTGTINDTQADAERMKTILDAKGYELKYKEVNESHSWGNWRALIDEPLEYFFPYDPSSVDENSESSIPTGFELKQNYPNPFNPDTTIEYSLPYENRVRITLYSLLGSEVAVLENGLKSAGKYSIHFEGDYLSAGVYFYNLKTDQISITKKMIIAK
ncbi:MAG: alpha/beta hydrolase-fold protein [Melioribacteraceae bacterium]